MILFYGPQNDQCVLPCYRTRTPHPAPPHHHACPRRGVAVIVAVAWRRDGRVATGNRPSRSPAASLAGGVVTSVYNSAKNTEFLARSVFNSSANFGPLMTNDGALKPWHQGEFVFGYLAGDRNNYNNKLLLQGKQTVMQIHRVKLKQICSKWDHRTVKCYWGSYLPKCQARVHQYAM